MRLSIRTGAALLCLALLPAVPAGASTEDNCVLAPEEQPASFIEACGTTVISGSEAGVSRLFIPEPVTFDLVEGYDIRVPGDRFGGFVLQQERTDTLAAHLLYAVSMPERMRVGEFFKTWSGEMGLLQPGNELTPGWYRLYLLTEPGIPTEAELRFEGLAGRRELQPEKPSTLKVASPLTPSVTSAIPETNYMASAAGDVLPGLFPPERPVGITIGGIAWKGNLPGVSRLGICRYQAPADPVLETSPACPTGPQPPFAEMSSNSTFIATGNGAYRSEFITSVGIWPRDYTFTAWANSVGDTDEVASIGVWISLD